MKKSSANSITVIEAGQTGKQYWLDIWRYRELFYVLSWRDLQVRYKQTFIGVLWAVIRPATTLLIFTFVFGRIAQLPAEGNVPYSLMVLAGVLPWQFFSTAVSESSNSLIGNESLITKVYFPRVIIPVSTVLTVVVDFIITLLILGVLMIYYQYLPSWHVFFLPFFLLLVFLLSIGIGLGLCALNVRFRDFRYAIPFLLQLGLFLSPVGFSSEALPEKWQQFYAFNPMVGIIDSFRWCLTDRPFPTFSFSVSLVLGFLLFFLGYKIFRGMERSFADHI